METKSQRHHLFPGRSPATLTKGQIALILQDAYWYADQVVNGGNMAPTRSEALARSFGRAHEAGLKLSSVLFPRVVATAEALQATILRYGTEVGVDARTGEVCAPAVVGSKVVDSSWDRVGVIVDVSNDVVTLDTGGKQYQARARDLRPVK